MPRLTAAFVLGVIRVAALIGVGVLGALVVAAVRRASPSDIWWWLWRSVAPLAGLLHWAESWIAHDAAYRLLDRMRLELYWKLESLAPAYLVRRRSGDLVSVATQDVELVEYFFAHTVAPALVAVLIPGAIVVVLGWHGAALALVLLPLPRGGAREPDSRPLAHRPAGLRRARGVRRHERACGGLGAGAGRAARLPGHGRARRRLHRAGAPVRGGTPAAPPRPRAAGLMAEMATGAGGLAVIWTGAALAASGRLDAGILPLLTLLAMSAFVPIWKSPRWAASSPTPSAPRGVCMPFTRAVPVRDGEGVPSGAGVTGGAGARRRGP